MLREQPRIPWVSEFAPPHSPSPMHSWSLGWGRVRVLHLVVKAIPRIVNLCIIKVRMGRVIRTHIRCSYDASGAHRRPKLTAVRREAPQRCVTCWRWCPSWRDATRQRRPGTYCVSPSLCHSDAHKLQIKRLGFGPVRQQMALNDWQIPKPWRRTCSPRNGLNSWRRKEIGGRHETAA